MKFFMYGRGLIGLILMSICIFSAQVSGATTTPLEQVKVTVNAILAVMQEKDAVNQGQREERRDRIMALINERFDFAEMSMRTLGRSWKTGTESEKDEFQKLFSELLKQNYIGRIEAYSDETVEYSKEIFDPNKNERALVYTKILKNSHEIPINYSLLQKDGDWFVYDVFIEGVSLVRNYRTEFGRILNKEKFAGLLVRMDEKIKSNDAKRKADD